MTEKVALITGITGQDGSYLSELLLSKGYIVYGIIRRTSNINNTSRIDHIFHLLKLRYADLIDLSSLVMILTEIKQNHLFDYLEIYNLAAQSHVKVSFDMPIYSTEVDAIGTLNLFEAVRHTNLITKSRIYQASTSELYGKVLEIPQSETTPFNPQSPYAAAKQFSFTLSEIYKKSYNMYISNGILFNHESPRRAVNFLPRKVTFSVGKILRGEMNCLELGNLNSLRDWGHAKDYVRAMWMILQQPEPDNYVVSTGEQHSIKELVEIVFSRAGMPLSWMGVGVDEVGIHDGKVLVKINPRFFRPLEVDTLLGNPTKIKRDLGWEPEYSFKQLIEEMCDYDFT